ncbi:collagen binding domain-containing protein [Comamonas sp. JC664]|uniref:MSCRAMM family protein n=1 Tax=Comamonas sp. JC664 TaxID=2801917 RepID=UPI0036167CE9
MAAQNVQVKLVDNSGNPPPAWVFLASGNQIGAIDVGGEVPIQVTASPGKNVADGIYNYKLIVTAGNSGDGVIPVSVAVTQSGQGGVSFQITDLFTGTLGADNQPIKGVAGARIRLQNDAVLTYLRTLTTDAEGKAVVTDLPPGTYTYRASGPRHSDKTGRFFVRPASPPQSGCTCSTKPSALISASRKPPFPMSTTSTWKPRSRPRCPHLWCCWSRCPSTCPSCKLARSTPAS